LVPTHEGTEVVLLPLSLSARGQGELSEMSQPISAAFNFAVKEASSLTTKNEAEGAVILLVDVSDA
jgi:hypothetical protein